MSQIRQAIERAKANSTSERSLVARLRAEHIDAIFRRTEDGRVYGATFVDHGSRTVLNGSALGKKYAACVWDEWFKNRPPEPEQVETPAMTNEPIPAEVREPMGGPEPLPGHEGELTLVGETLLEGLDVFGRFLRRETRFMSTSPRSSGCCTARSAKRNSEGRDFSHGPRPVSLPGFRRLCWSVLLLVFLCLSVLSRAAPNSPFPPARKITDCPGCRTRLYGAPLSGGLAYAPDNPFAGR